MNAGFDPESSLPRALYSKISRMRVEEPDLPSQEAAARTRREQLTRDGKLVILACDHPGRRVTAAAGNPLAMADRYDYLSRIVRILTQPGIDGVMSTPDIIDELLIVSALTRAQTGRSFLDEKVLMGCMNRGGLASAAFEMRDRFGAFSASRLKKMGLDAAKMMFRLDLDDPASGKTIQDCAKALRRLDEEDLYAFLEPLPVTPTESGYKVDKTAPALSTVIGVATALGDSSKRLWLKIPYVEDYSLVTRATTCPILMLGGPSRENPLDVLSDFAAGLAAGDNVRGVLVGRNILFPGRDDPALMARAIARIVHDGVAPEQALNDR